MAKKKARKKKATNIVDQLKTAIGESGLTSYRISKMSGVAQPVLDRFLSGERKNITITTASKLCKVLNLELKPKR